MYKNTPYISTKIWGYENWLVSSMADGRSSLASDSKDTKQKPLDKITGVSFPLLIKVIQANATLSVQVHPDDAYAKVHENTTGKTECWYVLDAKEGTRLICGLSKDFSKEQIAQILKEGTLDAHLNMIEIKKGDFLYVPAGTVHAITRGSRLLEVQQACDVTYRLFDWGRPRILHIKEGIDVIKKTPFFVQSPFSDHFSCEYFSIDLQKINKKTILPATRNGKWTCLVVTQGTLGLESDNGTNFLAKAEDAFVIGPDETITMTPQTKTLDIIKVCY